MFFFLGARPSLLKNTRTIQNDGLPLGRVLVVLYQFFSENKQGKMNFPLKNMLNSEQSYRENEDKGEKYTKRGPVKLQVLLG